MIAFWGVQLFKKKFLYFLFLSKISNHLSDASGGLSMHQACVLELGMQWSTKQT